MTLGLFHVPEALLKKSPLQDNLDRSDKVILKALSFNDRNKRLVFAMLCVQPPALGWGGDQIITELVYLMLRKAASSRHVK